MLDLDQDSTARTTYATMFSKKEGSPTDTMKRTGDWIFSQEIPSDVTVRAGGTSFALHKFPLVSKCGFIRKLFSESSDPDLSDIEIPDVPGGAEAFELAAKFCYGINFELGTENIAALRCVSEYLEMTEDYAVGNLVGRTEAYLNEVALKSLGGAISILHSTEEFLSMAEKVKLVNQCVDAIALMASKESQLNVSGGSENSCDGVYSSSPHSKPIDDWWAEDLTVLRIDIFQRVLIAMIARGFKQYALGPILMLYAQKSLRGLEMFGKGRKNMEPKQEHEKRVVLETIVSLLPREKNAISVSFLSMLLRASIYLETTVACRLDLEKRMGLQLGQAVLDDLLIPSFSFTGGTLFDIDTVQRILSNYLEGKDEGNSMGDYNADDQGYILPPQNDMEQVGKLMESYLAEIASDRSLTVLRFISIAECIPEQSRSTEDGMYRAIDIYLKAHPALSDMERKKVCSVMDCQKLSREACAHAAQNDRLPVQTVVQVLYYEQQRLREVMDSTASHSTAEPPSPAPKANANSAIVRSKSADEYASLRRENQDLKLELAKMKMQLKELKKPPAERSSPSTPSADKPPLPRKSLISSVSRKLGRLGALVRPDTLASSSRGRTKAPKDRRHSVS
ncbi:hypothetical protein ACET3Z_026967 [Daucus carota]